MALIDSLNSNVKSAEYTARRAREKAQKEKQAEHDRLTDRGYATAQEDIPKITEALLKASKAGARKYSHEIFRWSQDTQIGPYHASYMRTVMEHFDKEKIHRCTRWSDMEPCGSDPIFPYTVYDLDIEFSW